MKGNLSLEGLDVLRIEGVVIRMQILDCDTHTTRLPRASMHAAESALAYIWEAPRPIQCP
jgi:hypothetical protein